MELLPGDSEACTITVTADTDLAGATVAWSLDGGDTWVGATWAGAATYDAKTLTWSRPSQVTLSRSPASAGTVVTRDVYPVLTRVTIGSTVLIRPGTARIRLPDVTPPPRPPVPGRGVPGGLAGLDSAGDVVDATNRKAVVTTDARLSDQRVPTDSSVTDAKVTAISETKVTNLVTDLAGRLAYLPGLTGDGVTDDTAAINAGIAAVGTATARLRPARTYLISAPIVLASGQHLDATGARIVLAAGSNCNMLQNAAVAAVHRTVDAVMTAGSAVLTSVAGGLTSTMVGRPVTVQQVGPGGAPLTTTVASWQSATQVTLAVAASTSSDSTPHRAPTDMTVGTYAAVGARDSHITVTGGTWDRGANNSSPPSSFDAHNMRFRHVDVLTVRGTRHASTSGKYGVNPGDCTMVRCDANTFPAGEFSSDGVHTNGPASQVVVTSTLGGSMHDDLVSFTARDSVPEITDCAGDITDVVVDTAMLAAGTAGGFAAALKVIAGQGCAVRRLAARNLTGPTSTSWVVYVGDQTGGTFDDITLDRVRSLGGSSSFGCVTLHGGTMDRVRVTNVHPTVGDYCTVAVDTSVNRLSIEGASDAGGSRHVVLVTTATGVVTTLACSKIHTNGSTGAVLRVDNNAALTNVELSDIRLSGSKLVEAIAPASLTRVQATNVVAAGTAYPLGVYQTTTALSCANVTATGMTAWLWVQASGALTLLGATGMSGDTDTYTGALTIARSASVLTQDPDTLTVGQESIPRLLAQASPQLSTGQLVLTYFTARRTETITTVTTVTGGTAAAGTTLARIGVYSVASNSDLTLVASTANDTTLWGTTFAAPARAFTAPWAKTAGQRYALAMLFVGTTGPRLSGATAANGGQMALAPRLNGNVAGQSDLPSTVTAGSVANTQGISVYASLTP